MLLLTLRILLLTFGLGGLAAASAQTGASITPGSNFGPIPDGVGGGPLAYGEPRDILFNVQNRSGTIDEVRVFFNANHSFVGDLKVQLIAPDGRSHLLFERTGATNSSSAGFGSNLIDSVQYFFGDDYATVSGTDWWSAADVGDADIGPANLFSTVISGGEGVSNPAPVTSMTETFRSADPNGIWILRFEDGWGGDTGEVLNAELVITATGADRIVDNLSDDGPGSLREALSLAQPTDAIRIREASVAGANEFINLQSRLPVIPDGVGVFGPSESTLIIQRTGSEGFRIFEVPNGHQTTVARFWLNNGRENNSQGGGILNQGVLTVVDCNFTENFSLGGGAIMSRNAVLTLLRSSLIGNGSQFGGAGLQIRGNSKARIFDSTFSSQLSVNANNESISVLAQGGSRGFLELRNSTITDLNNRGNVGLVVASQGVGSQTEVVLSNNLFDNQRNVQSLTFSGGEAPVIISQGHNLATDQANGLLDQSTDRLGAKPRLRALLSQNGTFFHTLGAGSDAIDQGRAGGSRLSDARGPGFQRVVNADNAIYPDAPGSDGSDIGAVEMQDGEIPSDQIFNNRFENE